MVYADDGVLVFLGTLKYSIAYSYIIIYQLLECQIF